MRQQAIPITAGMLIEKLRQFPPETAVWLYNWEYNVYEPFWEVDFIKDGGLNFDKPLRAGEYEKVDIIGLDGPRAK